MKVSSAVEVDVLDGYRRIVKEPESRLGWRIVLATRPFDGDADVLRKALPAYAELAAALPSGYVTKHRYLASLVGKLLEGEPLSANEEAALTAAVGRSLDEIKAFLAIEDVEDIETDSVPAADPEYGPDILFTSLVGSKGLSAERVFIVGMNDGHFPRRQDLVTDDEVCDFLVALSRTRKCCHVISCGFFGKGYLKESLFLSWIRQHLQLVVVDKKYDFSP